MVKQRKKEKNHGADRLLPSIFHHQKAPLAEPDGEEKGVEFPANGGPGAR